MLIRSSKYDAVFPVRRLFVCFIGLALVAWVSTGYAQDSEPDPSISQPAAETSTATEDQAAPETPDPEPAGVKNPVDYDLWVLAPAVVAIVLTMLMRQAVPALFIGVVVGAYMLVPCREASAVPGDSAWLGGIRLAVETYIIQNLYFYEGSLNAGRIQVVMFTLIIGGAVGVMAASGGSLALVNWVSRYASTSRRGQLTGWLAGMVVFFDDYANSMLVGPTMRPMFDRLKISRAKLAYIVDSTAAPVASIALIGTWLGAELSYIENGLSSVASRGTPAFMADMESMGIFINTIPYRFYPLFALWMVLVVALTGLDFGPMRRSESRALIEPPADPQRGADGHDPIPASSSLWLAAIPILVLVGVTVAILYFTGVASLEPGTEKTFSNILKNADSYLSILYGAISSLSIAVILASSTGACSIRVAFDGAMDGMAKMFPAIVILVLAWSLSEISKDLQLGHVLKTHLLEADIAPDWLPMRVWLPLSIFVCAAGVSFATGTSWTTMGILTPAVVEVAAEMAGGLPAGEDLQLFYAAVGSVLAGSIFGDHCSPISDTTVLSSVASGCRVEEHVWTQMPYAIVAALASMGAGIYYCMHENQPAWMGLAIGAAAILLIVLLIGRRPKPPPAPPYITPERIDARLGVDQD